MTHAIFIDSLFPIRVGMFSSTYHSFSYGNVLLQNDLATKIMISTTGFIFLTQVGITSIFMLSRL